MTLLEYFKSAFMLTNARAHLKQVMQQLHLQSYDAIIHQAIPATQNHASLESLVKSYFWAARTLKNCHCLPRSMALYQKLRSLGYAVEHKFGVNNDDKNFTAHAWVEYNDKPLNEAPDLKQKFTLMTPPAQSS